MEDTKIRDHRLAMEHEGITWLVRRVTGFSAPSPNHLHSLSGSSQLRWSLCTFCGKSPSERQWKSSGLGLALDSQAAWAMRRWEGPSSPQAWGSQENVSGEKTYRQAKSYLDPLSKSHWLPGLSPSKMFIAPIFEKVFPKLGAGKHYLLGVFQSFFWVKKTINMPWSIKFGKSFNLLGIDHWWGKPAFLELTDCFLSCICVYVYTCLHVCVYMCYMHAYTYIVYVYICLCAYVYVYMCLYVCANVYTWICIYVFMCVCLYAYVIMCMSLGIYVFVYMYVYMCLFMCICVYMYSVYVFMYMSLYVCVWICVCVHI